MPFLQFTQDMPYIGKMTDIPFTGIKAILAGHSGTGKTRSLMTCPKPALYITSEKKYSSVEPSAMKDITIAGISNFQQFVNVLMQNGQQSHNPDYIYKTIFIDSLTDLANMRVNEIRSTVKDGRQAYFQTQTEMMEIFRIMRDAATNIIGICLLSRYQDSENYTKYGPMFPGQQLSQVVPSQFDEIYVAQSRRSPEGHIEYFFQTVNDGKYECKSTSGVLPPFMEPDWSKIISMIESRTQFFDQIIKQPVY